MLSKRKFIIAGALVAVLLVAGIGGTMALAQSPTPQTASGAKTLADLFWQAFAQKLGTTVDKAQQAETDARKDSIAQGVTQGLLTQAQADAMLQRMQNGAPGALFGNFGRGARGAAGPLDGASASVASAELDAAAKALGMTTADLTTALQS
ncbi:MAG TPA: hypothetical protein VF429_10260, partial [Anaerolineae bacterium]